MEYNSGSLYEAFSLELNHFIGRHVHSISFIISGDVMRAKDGIMGVVTCLTSVFTISDIDIPIPCTLYIQHHSLNFREKGGEFANAVNMIENSYSSVKTLWNEKIVSTNLSNLIAPLDEGSKVRLANQILAAAKLQGLID